LKHTFYIVFRFFYIAWNTWRELCGACIKTLILWWTFLSICYISILLIFKVVPWKIWQLNCAIMLSKRDWVIVGFLLIWIIVIWYFGLILRFWVWEFVEGGFFFPYFSVGLNSNLASENRICIYFLVSFFVGLNSGVVEVTIYDIAY